jgi:predicted AAA+ superfamily ATPase
MKRLIDYHLLEWKGDKDRKPLLLRGARQVGKTYAVRVLGKTFTDFIEINLETLPHFIQIFEKDLLPERIVLEISVLLKKPIIPGKTLLFIDEIQVAPKAILALRYFYELMPELHVIAAGSLLDFAIAEVGIPVGRIQSLYMYPVSFIEFLAAQQATLLIEEILAHKIEQPLSDVIHEQSLALVGEYLAIGGMPQVVNCWATAKDPLRCGKFHFSLLDAYRQDFSKYASKFQIKYVEQIFSSIPRQLGNKFKYSVIEGEYRKRELAPALDLLVTAGIAHKVFHSAGQGIPLGAQVDPTDYKVIFLDIGLSQAVLDLDLAGWFVDPISEFVNKGSLVEAFVGQELLAYSDPHMKRNLYYWNRKDRSSIAEVDYLMQKKQIVPIEVKSGKGSTLRSINLFLETHPQSSYGIRFSTQNYSRHNNIDSYPLYAIVAAASSEQGNIKKALESLL